MDVYMWKYHKNKCVLLLFWGSVLLLSCENKKVKACGSFMKQTSTEVNENEQEKHRSKTKHIGSVYFYYEADESAVVEKEHWEDEIIRLERTDDTMRGTFWVTSDEFASAREGYLPGFTVLDMQNLRLHSDSIFFLLDSHGCKFFSAPIGIDTDSDKEAKRQGCHKWLQESSFFADAIQYRGVILGDTLFLDETKNRWSRKFVRRSEKEVSQMDRTMDARLEVQNRSKSEGDGQEIYRPAWL